MRNLPKNKIDIKTILRIIGAADAAANLLCELRIAAKKEDRLTNIKNGRVILVKFTANWIFSGLSTKPGAINLTKVGMKTSIIKTKNNRPKNKKTGSVNLYKIDVTGFKELKMITPADASDPAWSPIIP